MAGGGGLIVIDGNPSWIASAVGADVVITLPATPGKYWLIPGLIYSYDLLPSVIGGIVLSDGVFSFTWDEVANGGIVVPFEPHLRCGQGNAVTLRLKSGGAGVTGKLNIVPGPYLQG
jgi:hypothetical protein